MIFTSFLGFLFGVVLRKIPGATMGAGDQKMLMVIFPLLSIHEETLRIALSFSLLYLIFSLLIIRGCRVIQKKMHSEEVKFGTYTIKKNLIETPEAIPMLISVLCVPILF